MNGKDIVFLVLVAGFAFVLYAALVQPYQTTLPFCSALAKNGGEEYLRESPPPCRNPVP